MGVRPKRKSLRVCHTENRQTRLEAAIVASKGWAETCGPCAKADDALKKLGVPSKRESAIGGRYKAPSCTRLTHYPVFGLQKNDG
jgi:hypothetical protein